MQPEISVPALIAGDRAEFARMVGDVHFETRLRLSRARSFITSSRLITDPDFALEIYLQGVRLLERTAAVAAR